MTIRDGKFLCPRNHVLGFLAVRRLGGEKITRLFLYRHAQSVDDEVLMSLVAAIVDSANNIVCDMCETEGEVTFSDWHLSEQALTAAANSRRFTRGKRSLTLAEKNAAHVVK